MEIIETLFTAVAICLVFVIVYAACQLLSTAM